MIDFCRNAGLSLPEGWKASQLKAEQPTATHSEFVKDKIREAARALSMPLNIALCDSSGYNYASGRLDHQTYFRKITGERNLIEQTILENVLESYEELDRLFFPEDYFTKGKATAPEIEYEWMWDGFQHVDPLKEANAQAVRLKSGTTTLADECGAEGRDFMKVIRQRVREEAIERNERKKYNLPEIPPASGATGATDEGEENGE